MKGLRTFALLAGGLWLVCAGCGEDEIDGRLRIRLVPPCEPAFEDFTEQVDTYCIQIEDLDYGLITESCSETLQGVRLPAQERPDRVRVVVEALRDSEVLARGRSVPVELVSGEERSIRIPVAPVGRFALVASNESGCVSLPYPAVRHTATVFPSGHVLVAGSSHPDTPGTAAAFLLGPQGEPGATLSTPASLRRGRHSATLLDDGRLALLGGEVTEEYATDIVMLAEPGPLLHLFDPDADYPGSIVFETLSGALAAPRRVHDAARFHGNQVLINDGENPAGMFLAGEERSDFIQVAGPDPFPTGGVRQPVTVVPLDAGMAILLGGEADHNGLLTVTQGSRRVEYRPYDLPVAQRNRPAGLALPDGRVMFLGGLAGSMESPIIVLDPAVPAISQIEVDRASFPNRGFTADVFPNGWVAVVGGVSVNPQFEPGSTFLLEPTGGVPGGYRVLRGPKLVMPRTDHTTSLLPDGRLLVIGGEAVAGTDVTNDQVALSAEVITF